jgi:transcriptional regulator with XRE-family HTH domain
MEVNIYERKNFKGSHSNKDDLDNEFELLESIIKARESAGLTQEELAKRIGTKQPALSRLERGGFQKANIETLRKIAEALDVKLVIKFQPKAA